MLKYELKQLRAINDMISNEKKGQIKYQRKFLVYNSVDIN
jgi:hypothetical protein